MIGFMKWTELSPGYWTKVERLESVGRFAIRSPGVYKVVGLLRDTENIMPVPVERALGPDITGTLYIGEAKWLHDRLGNLLTDMRATRRGRVEKHQAARLLKSLAYSKRFPLSCIGVSWRFDPDHHFVEGNLIESYQLEFGELPPLNKQTNRLCRIPGNGGTERYF
jgi:hypothetical protein